MAGVLKYWRESASLILASRRLGAVKPQQSFMNQLFSKKETEPPVEQDELLRLLTVKRSSGSSYLPNVYVFPGGVVDNTDFSKDWLDMMRFNTSTELLNLFTYGKPGSPIFSRTRDSEFASVPSEVALRIAAIRETFEESGILLARSNDNLEVHGTHSLGTPLQGNIFDIPDKERKIWRKKVISEPSQFMNMCRELEVVPDIWSLYEWSNWLTPLLKKSHRFDTVFFQSCVDEGPPIEVDKGETVHGVWMNPANLLKACSHGLVSLAPPQTYELSRLARFASVDDLLTLACQRSKHRSARWMPWIIACKDGLVFLLPGDELYPEDPDYTGENSTNVPKREETFDELAAKFPQQNRAFINHKDKQLSLSCNLEYLEGHVLPVNFNRKSEFQPKW